MKRKLISHIHLQPPNSDRKTMNILIELVTFLFIFVLSLVLVFAHGEDNNNYCYRGRDPYAFIIKHYEQ